MSQALSADLVALDSENSNRIMKMDSAFTLAVQHPRCSRQCSATLDARKGTFSGHAIVDNEADVITGYGTFVGEDGYMFTGAWTDSLQNGPGVEMEAQGTETSGRWADGVLFATDRTRSLKQRFEDGPAERREALEVAGEWSMGSTTFYIWWVFHFSVGGYATVMAFWHWPASHNVNGNAFATASSMMCIYLLQVVLYFVYTWDHLRSPVPSATLYYQTFGAKVLLFVVELLVAAVAVLTGVFEGDQNLPLQTTAKMVLLLATGETGVMFLTYAVVDQLYAVIPKQVARRRVRAKQAYADGIIDYIDSNAYAFQSPIVDAWFLIVGASFLAWRVHFLINVHSGGAGDGTLTSSGSGDALMQAEDAPLINLDYFGVASYASCVCGGLVFYRAAILCGALVRSQATCLQGMCLGPLHSLLRGWAQSQRPSQYVWSCFDRMCRSRTCQGLGHFSCLRRLFGD
jgi:hypothetical protein